LRSSGQTGREQVVVIELDQAMFNRFDGEDRLTDLPPNRWALFALLSAERLRACCWAFASREARDLSVYRHKMG
jgi:hypothetical protein